MFLLYDKNSGCVVMKSTQHPKDMPLNLIDNLDEHFGIKEVSHTIKEISGMVCKVIDDKLEILGPISDTSFSDCGTCPDYQKD